MVSQAAAQRNQPVYPAYDGYIKNADGSYTLAFAYFNHNAEPVTIQPGPDNSFGPGPADRQQPVTFRTGHRRFQCVMVLGAEFDGKLRWTLTYAGTTTGTSENMLQSNWYLVEGAAELAKIDFAKVPQGRLPEPGADGPGAGARQGPRRSDDDRLAEGAAEPVRQRGGRRASALRQADFGVEAAQRTGHGELRPAGRSHPRHVQRARHLPARADGERLRVHQPHDDRTST